MNDFLNPDRISMPDFDIDFCQEGRDEVIKYVKDKYPNKVAQIITFGKLQARMALERYWQSTRFAIWKSRPAL